NCYLRIDTITDSMLRLLKKAGCHSLHLSVDSLSPYVREDILNRKMNDVNLIQVLRKIHKHGIGTWVNFMTSVPGSSVLDDLNTFMFSKLAKITFPHFTNVVPMKKTELYDYCVEHDIDMDVNAGFYDVSCLSCFSPLSKAVRHNINRLGIVLNKLPLP
ncbi:unnamed protein product, partial [marine sediment metagenome]